MAKALFKSRNRTIFTTYRQTLHTANSERTEENHEHSVIMTTVVSAEIPTEYLPLHWDFNRNWGKRSKYVV